MTDKENLSGSPNSGNDGGLAGAEIPIVPPVVVAFGDPEPPDDGKGDPEPPDTTTKTGDPEPPDSLAGALGDPEPPDDGSGS